MLPYPTPDVYYQDVFQAPEPTFLTGVPVFLGYAEKGPVNKPVPLYLWPQFMATFDQPFADGYLYYAVRGFFENGGLVATVIRLEDGIEPLQALKNGLAVARELEGVDVVCTPDIVGSTDFEAVIAMQDEVLNHCRLSGDRFAILDTPIASDREQVLKQSGRFNSSYGALYHSWLRVAGGPTGVTDVPPSGHVAGIFSRSDQNFGVHKAPANEVLEGILDLVSHPTLSEQRDMFANRVNYLRAFTGRGVRVWGARTLSQDTDWQYISTRRLFLTINRWLERFMTELPFEPNDHHLWIRIMREVAVYLDTLYQLGALKGATADHAFYVKCDAETNTADVRAVGLVVTEIGLATAVPGEFIVTRVIHGRSGVSITTDT